MMLHRHFEQEKNNNMTTLADVTPKVETECVSEPNEESVEAPKRRGRPKKGE